MNLAKTRPHLAAKPSTLPVNEFARLSNIRQFTELCAVIGSAVNRVRRSSHARQRRHLPADQQDLGSQIRLLSTKKGKTPRYGRACYQIVGMTHSLLLLSYRR
jgi:hypothetical protein